MCDDKRRYFIELHMDSRDEVPRNREAELRRAKATQFIGQIKAWIEQEALKEKVSSLAITALGQVLITCEKDIIARLREDEKLDIAAIRSSVPLSHTVQRLGG